MRTKLDQALLDFVRRTNRTPVVIYAGWNVLFEVRKDNQMCYHLDLRNKMYQGIPFYRVANEDDHLAIY